MQAQKSPKRREANEGFWKTWKGQQILAAKQRAEDRAIWGRLETWGG